MKKKKAYYEINVDIKAALPVYEQVKRAIKLAILSGQLREGDKLLTLSEMSQKLKVNPNTIIKVFYQLELEGFVYSRSGSGYYVKVDKRKTRKAKYSIFVEETQDYIDKAISLGYSYDDILEVVKETFQEETTPVEKPKKKRVKKTES